MTYNNDVPNKTLLSSVQAALHDAMSQDENVLLLGQDVAKNGGVFRCTDGLLDQFGAQRVVNMPIAENLMAGMAVGLASQGLIPIVEYQFMGFMYPALDQVINHMSRMRHRTGGRITCPIVLRAPYGAGIGAPEHHSESTEALFAHIPGIRVVIPSTPKRGYDLLRAAIDNADPVIFLEPTRLYHQPRKPDAFAAQYTLDTAYIDRTGADISIISWGASLHTVHETLPTLLQNNIDAEIIDLATVKPIDSQTIIHSVKKTGRCMIVHEAVKTGGIGAEISAILAEHAIGYLRAPIHRVTGYDTIVPYPKHEHIFLPNTKRILHSAKTLMEY